MLDSFFSLFSYDAGIDLGTVNTLVAVVGRGIVIREPSVVARHKKSKEILAIGSSARGMLGKTPATIEALRPLQGGVITDFDAVTALLSHYIRQIHQTPTLLPKLPYPQVAIGIPSGVTEVERRAVQEAALSAGARRCYLIEESMAAAIGINLSVTESKGILIVDIGGGTTEIAVISLAGIVLNRSLRLAGQVLDKAIVNYLRLKHSLVLGEPTAEEIKLQIGSAYERLTNEEERWAVVRGRSLETGLPKSLKISASEVREAMLPVINKIIDQVVAVLEETPPELLADILERGVVLTGGSALLVGLPKLLSERIKMPVWVVDEPMTAVVRGCAAVLENRELLEKVRVAGRVK